ncbi:MAG: Septum formation protein Maf [Firmicutes bacterium]|nr:Septum formation protein Maf [Bacillota bacterium]
MTFILASASPRRQELLRQIGCEFRTVVSSFMEDNSLDLPPKELAVFQARAKACDVARRLGTGNIVIGADTIVVQEGRVYGKPSDLADARRMLSELAGVEHAVITGLAVAVGEKVWTDFAVTMVRFRDLTSDEIDRYLATGESLDKAGAYAIQGRGALLVERIDGCYANVVGLPLTTLDKLIRLSMGVGLL